MADPPDNTTTLKRPVSTGRDNPVKVQPFDVQLHCPDKWDPSAKKLLTGYDINDPNGRIRRARIRFKVQGADGLVVAHEIKLTGGRLRHACHELPEAQWWDGLLDKAFPDRKGEKITAELSHIIAELEAWNTDNDEPGKRQKGDRSRTDRPGEFVARSTQLIAIDSIVKAKWDRNWCIPRMPAGHPEHDKGQVSMTVEARNVREGQEARIIVFRLNKIDDPESDFEYVDSAFADPDEQPGLQNLVVRKGKVVRSDDGSKPYLLLNLYDEHWKHPGNNFYGFRVAFGVGSDVGQSQRDYEKHEKQCLHMRFTVFIHHPSGDLWNSRAKAKRLHKFFRAKTKYFRSYLMLNGPKTFPDWFNHGVFTYMTLLIGHSACWCTHPGDKEKDPAKDEYDGHPVYWVGRGKKRTHKFKKLPDEHFDPEQNRCPTDVDKKKVGGCGRKEWVSHSFVLGRVSKSKAAGKYKGKKLWWSNHGGRKERDALLMTTEDVEARLYDHKKICPRFLFFADGCRTMLTTNLGEHYVQQGSQLFHGWVYSVSDSVAADMCDDLFIRWIKGTKKDPAPVEYDTDRFEQVYKTEAVKTRGRRRYHARLMNAGGVLNAAREKPDKKAEALE